MVCEPGALAHISRADMESMSMAPVAGSSVDDLESIKEKDTIQYDNAIARARDDQKKWYAELIKSSTAPKLDADDRLRQTNMYARLTNDAIKEIERLEIACGRRTAKPVAPVVRMQPPVAQPPAPSSQEPSQPTSPRAGSTTPTMQSRRMSQVFMSDQFDPSMAVDPLIGLAALTPSQLIERIAGMYRERADLEKQNATRVETLHAASQREMAANAALRVELDTARTERAQTHAEGARLARLLQECEADRASCGTAPQNESARIAELEKEVADAEGALDSTMAYFKMGIAERDQCLASLANFKTLEGEIRADYEKKLQDRHAEYQEAARKMQEQWGSAIAAKDERIAVLQRELAAGSTPMEGVEGQTPESIELMKSKIVQFEREVLQKDGEIAGLQLQVNACHAASAADTKEIASLKKNHTKVVKEAKELRAKVVTLQTKVATLMQPDNGDGTTLYAVDPGT